MMSKNLSQAPFVAIFISISFIVLLIMVSNQNFTGKSFAAGPSGQASTIKLPLPCPAGSIEISQKDIDQALALNLPYVITEPAEYCLKEDIIVDGSDTRYFPVSRGRAEGKVIQTATSSVILDLNGYSIVNTAGSNALRGIYSLIYAIDVPGDTNKPNGDILIKNGQINGFDTAVSSAANRVTPGLNKLTVEGITFVGNADAVNIFFNGQEIELNNNIVTQGNRALYLYHRYAGFNLKEVIIKDNKFYVHSDGIVITATTPNKVRIKNNIIEREKLLIPPLNPRASRFEGIHLSGGSRNLGIIDAEIEDNTISNFRYGISAINFVTAGARNNKGCRLGTPIDARLPARIWDINNNWNYQNC